MHERQRQQDRAGQGKARGREEIIKRRIIGHVIIQLMMMMTMTVKGLKGENVGATNRPAMIDWTRTARRVFFFQEI